MKGFIPGLLLGIGLGLLFAPMPGEDARRILRNMSGTELVSEYAQQIINSLSQGSTSLGDLTQFSVSRIIEENGSTFMSLADLLLNKVAVDGSAFNSIGSMLDRVVGSVRG